MTATTPERLTKIETNVSHIRETVNEIKENMINAGEFKMIKGIVLGFTGLILITVASLMISTAIGGNRQSNNEGVGTTGAYISTPTPATLTVPEVFDDDKKKLNLTSF